MTLPDTLEQIPVEDVPASVITELRNHTRDYMIATGRNYLAFDALQKVLGWWAYLTPPVLWAALGYDIRLDAWASVPEHNVAAQMVRCGWTCHAEFCTVDDPCVALYDYIAARGMVRTWREKGFARFAWLPPFLWWNCAKRCPFDFYIRASFKDVARKMISYECEPPGES